MRQNDTTAPKVSADANNARRLLNANTSARGKKPPAASPDEKEQFLWHSPLMTKGGV
jgi:hypothetical protein